MERELSTGMTILLTIVLLSVLIATVVSLVFYFNTKAEEENDTLNSTSAGFTNAQWDRFDQVKLTGVEVQAAIEMYMHTEATVVVAKKSGNSFKFFCYGQGVKVTGNPNANSDIQSEPTTGSCTTSLSGSIATFLGTNTQSLRVPTDDAFIRSSASYNSKLLKDAGNNTLGVIFVTTQ